MGPALLVKGSRPIVERVTLELPSGHINEGESPGQAAMCELKEETEYQVQELELPGTFAPNTDRPGNTLWYLFSPRGKCAVTFSTSHDAGIAVACCNPAQLTKHLLDGQFSHALNLAVIPLAMRRETRRFA